MQLTNKLLTLDYSFGSEMNNRQIQQEQVEAIWISSVCW